MPSTRLQPPRSTFSGVVGRGHGEGVVAEAGDKVEAAAEGFDVTGDGFDGGQFAAFDLGDPAGGDAHRLGELGLCEPLALTLARQPVSRLAGHEVLAAPLGLFQAADPFDVGGAVPLAVFTHHPDSSYARSSSETPY